MKKRKPCTCIRRLNKKLARENTELDTVYLLGSGFLICAVRTIKIEPRNRRFLTICATYCPFCGRKYPQSEKDLAPKRQD